ncbi:MAG: coxS [Sphingomonas bacterium]|nr:(2Fe-2S)-binding protein [Sphingomonas bacterium]MDB5689025.1 coxS [Sphingomonas bacterium]
MPRLTADRRHPVSFTLNGKRVSGQAEPRMLLSDFLRHEIGATGTHLGCEHGVCGACTVQIDGGLARACLALAVQTEGAEVRTVEGLSPDGGATLSVLQNAFREHHGLQCGFCTPGFLVTLDALFRNEPHASEDRIREMLSGHLCRCTGYAPIIKAALAAQATLLASAAKPDPDDAMPEEDVHA